MMAAVMVCAACPCLQVRAADGLAAEDAAGRTASNQSITIDAPSQEPGSVKTSPDEGLSDQEVNETEAHTTAGDALVESSRSRHPGLVRRARTDGTFAGDRGVSSAFDAGGLIALGVVLVVVGVVFWFLRRMVPSLRNAEHSALQVVARAAVTPKHNVALVRLGRRYVLIGVGGERMSRLCEVSEPQEVAELTAHFGGTMRGEGSAFSQLLARETAEYNEDERTGDSGDGADEQSASAGIDGERMPGLIRLRQRLRSLKAG